MRTTLALLLTIAPMAAQAQDVVVMRRQVAAPTQTHSAAQWRPGEWTWSTTDECTASAPQVRTMECVLGDQVVPDARCAGTRPETTRTIERMSGCGYEWAVGEWTAFDSTCSLNATRTRSVTCQRSDGAVADSDSRCSGERPASSESRLSQGSCQFNWKKHPASYGWLSEYESGKSGTCDGGSITLLEPWTCFNGNSGVYQARECINNGPGDLPGEIIFGGNGRLTKGVYACQITNVSASTSDSNLSGESATRSTWIASGSFVAAGSIGSSTIRSQAAAACTAALQSTGRDAETCAYGSTWLNPTTGERVIAWTLKRGTTRYYRQNGTQTCNQHTGDNPGAGWQSQGCPTFYLPIQATYVVKAKSASEYVCKNQAVSAGWRSNVDPGDGAFVRLLNCVD